MAKTPPSDDLLSAGDGGVETGSSSSGTGATGDVQTNPVDTAAADREAALQAQVEQLQADLTASQANAQQLVSQVAAAGDTQAQFAALSEQIQALKSAQEESAQTMRDAATILQPVPGFGSVKHVIRDEIDNFEDDQDEGVTAPSLNVGSGNYIVNPRRSVEHDGKTYAENNYISLSAADAESLLTDGFIRPVREEIYRA